MVDTEGISDPWPAILDEIALVRLLLGISDDWVICRASSRVVSLASREITSLEVWGFQALLDREAQHLEEQSALRAFRLATAGLKQPRNDQPAGHGAGNRNRNRRSRPGVDRHAGSDRSGDCERSKDRSSDTMSDGAAFTCDVARAERPRRRRARATSAAEDAGGRSDAPEKGDEGDGQASSRVAVKPVRMSVAGGNVLETIGSVTICKVFRHGTLHALSLQCKRHRDLGEGDHVQCARDLTLSKGFTQDEAIRRLKRWYISGLYDNEWPADSMRTQHKSLGGQLLRDFADGSPEWGEIGNDDLDALIEAHK